MPEGSEKRPCPSTGEGDVTVSLLTTTRRLQIAPGDWAFCRIP
jgi:hypothetical protein